MQGIVAGVTRRAAVQNVARRHVGTSATAGGIKDPDAYCRDVVRRHDYESFLVSRLYPPAAQPAYFALKAFYVELGNVRSTASNGMLGKMRFQFWRDAVKGVAEGRPVQHPVALALAEASRRARLTPYHLNRIIDARDAELAGPHMTVDGLASHGEATASTLNYLLLSALDLSESERLAHAASHLGVAQAIVESLRALAAGRSDALPAEVSARAGVSTEDVGRARGAAAGVQDAVFALASEANAHLFAAREQFKDEVGGRVPGRAVGVFGGGVAVATFLSRLQKAGFDAWARKIQNRDADWLLAYKLWTFARNPSF